jgi:hypothetical protein
MSDNGHWNAAWLKVNFVEVAENITETIPRIVKRSPQRSRVGNGAKLLPLTDGRSATARRFKDLVEDICADLGGKDHLSTGELQLIRRASMLSAECEKQEALAAREDVAFDADSYVVKTNALKRVLEVLGLKRVPRQVNDGSAILSDYFKG